MKKITVKKPKQHTILELNDDICCYHYAASLTTNVTKKFRIQDISRVECCGAETKEWVYLRDSQNKLLAKFNIQCEGAYEAIQFFYNCNLHKLTNENGEYYPEFDIILSEEQRDLTLKETVRELLDILPIGVGFFGLLALMLIQENVLMGENSWGFAIFGVIILLPYLVLWILGIFYFPKREGEIKTKILRMVSHTLNLAGMILACTYFLIPLTLCMKILYAYQLVVGLFCILFHKKLYFMLAEEGKVLVPYWGVIWFAMASTYYTYTNAMYPAFLNDTRMGITFLAALFMFATSLFDGNGWSTIWGRVTFVALLSFLCTEELPVAFDTGESYHIEAEILEKEEHISSRNANKYYLYLETEDGEYIKEMISQILFNDVEKGDTVYLCMHESMLSDYYYLHLPESDCGQIWLNSN